MLRRPIIFFILAVFTNTMIFPEVCFPAEAIIVEDVSSSRTEIFESISVVLGLYLDLDKDLPLEGKDQQPFSLDYFQFLDYVADYKCFKPVRSFLLIEKTHPYKHQFCKPFFPEAPELPPQVS